MQAHASHAGRVVEQQAPINPTTLTSTPSADCAKLEEDAQLQKSPRRLSSPLSTSVMAPLGDTSLLGHTNVLIPVSTLELFFQRFDMLQHQLDELRSLIRGGSESRSVSPVLSTGGAAVDCDNLNARVSTLEGVTATLSNMLDESNTNTRLVLKCTEDLKDDLIKVQAGIEDLRRSYRNQHTDSNSCNTCNVVTDKVDQIDCPTNVNSPHVRLTPSIKSSYPRLDRGAGGGGTQ